MRLPTLGTEGLMHRAQGLTLLRAQALSVSKAVAVASSRALSPTLAATLAAAPLELAGGLGVAAASVAPRAGAGVDLWRPRLLADGCLAMSPMQELANAFTMLIPLAVALSTSALPAGVGAHVIAAAIVFHFPFSFLYHLACAGAPERHPVVGNAWCKGDLIAIHIAGATMALGTSGSLEYTVCNGVFNAVCSVRTLLWCNSQLERRACRLLCALGYILPIGAHDPALCRLAASAFLAVSLPFVCNGRLGGWGHALSHVVLGPFAYSIVTAASVVPAPVSEAPAAFVALVNAALGAASASLLTVADIVS